MAGWTECWDEEDKRSYWTSTASGESTWVKPEEPAAKKAKAAAGGFLKVKAVKKSGSTGYGRGRAVPMTQDDEGWDHAPTANTRVAEDDDEDNPIVGRDGSFER